MTDWRFDPDDLDRLLTRHAISRRQLLGGLVALGLSGGAMSIKTLRREEAPGPTARYYVLIVMDAFRADYTSLAPMPALNGLRRHGITYNRAWVGQLESLTPASHATLTTGLVPRNHGIVGLEWRNPVTHKEALDGWEQGAMLGQLGRDLRQHGVKSLPLAVKAVDAHAKIVSLSSEKIYAADAMSASWADYVLYHRWSGKNDQTLSPAALAGHVPPAHYFAHPHLQMKGPIKHFTDWDNLSTKLALAAIQDFRPRVLMVNLPGPDVFGHQFGGPATPAVMRQVVAGVDKNIGQIVNAYKAAGIYDQTVFVVVGDHGMVPNNRVATGYNEAARKAGGNLIFSTGGTAAYIYLKNPQQTTKVAERVAGATNIAGSYYQTASQPQPAFVPAPGVTLDSSLDAAYRYLLNTFAGPAGPDVVTPFRENTIASTEKTAYGNHGGLSWGVQHVPLTISGPGVPTGAVSNFPARLMDVAPTVGRLLGLSPWQTDGIVLADALTPAPPADVIAQNALAGPLTEYQDALIAQSKSHIDEDRRRHLTPPRSRPLHP